jgi:hypothetical protein
MNKPNKTTANAEPPTLPAKLQPKPTLMRTKALLLAALRVWELKRRAIDERLEALNLKDAA